MAKDKKKTIGIKTTRYFTKTCSKCNFEYPNWFTNCPKCGVAWDEAEIEEFEESGEPKKKTIKIVVKITEEDFDNKLDAVKLIFSADHGKTWFQMKMENKMDYFIAEIVEVPIGSLIIYYIEVMLVNGESVIENNDGKYYLYKVGISLKQTEKKPIKSEIETKKAQIRQVPQNIQEDSISKEKKVDSTGKLTKQMFVKSTKIPQKSRQIIKTSDNQVSTVKPPNKPIEYKIEDSTTIFGKPQTQIDPELKICPHCKSKIKKMWSTCPICGKTI
ncbi:MAG: hypothetical protein ACFE8M_05460 [Candidatus Hermodarchaeota archaeon]